ncbi:hypothetical protein BJ138DRAFT_1121017 [Hygrophoropsis aurantiaca]|uniref:Uncharacterized protein n=1 Tax=Hygrophoropsis aurantiaca TaxID=72124 RepID=A0ACB7ZQ82_9AGAM|nr:hypothetical protein BJ138DRAFT_1121017 [Hygrophoropsis aurantiaca]
MLYLAQFLSLAPQLEYLNLDLWTDETSDCLIFQIIPFTPCVVTPEFNFRAVPDALTLNKMFEMFGHTSTSPLPKLQHLTLNVMKFGREAKPLMYDAEMLLHMLESRCNLNQTSLDGPPGTVGILRSYTMNYKDCRGDPIQDSPLSWAVDAKRRLKALEQHGLVLEGVVFTSLLYDNQRLCPTSNFDILRFFDSYM